MHWLLLMACGEAGADEVAAVMLVDGAAWVERAGARSPAVPGALLERGDVLVTGADGAIVVQLRNDHVVRVDAELELPVSEIVMLNAEKSEADPGAQIANLIYPDERERLGGAVLDAERVAGWSSRIHAAHAPSGARRVERAAPPDRSPRAEPEADGLKAEPQEELSSGPVGGVVDADIDVVSEAKNKEGTKGSSAQPRDDGQRAQPSADRLGLAPTTNAPPPDRSPGTGGSAPISSGIPAQPTPPMPAGIAGPPPSTVDALAVRFGPAGDLRACVVEWAASLPSPPGDLVVRLVVRDGVVVRVVVEEGGLRLPGCARAVLEGAAIDAPARLTLDL